jgi:two-component system nitrogen regulation response regulator GlnG
VHQLSRRRNAPFVEVNCAAIPEELIESELFGHMKGAFTGAVVDKPGRFEQATTGTIFLDEIGDMSLKTQAKVLRVLQEQVMERVGGTQRIKVDVRVLAATNKDLPSEIRAGAFREDLYFRLNVIPIFVPPLRDRQDDIPLLADHFMALMAAEYGRRPKRVAPEARARLQHYPWPGNVRELRNALEHAAIESRGGPLRPEHFPEPASVAGPAGIADRVKSLVVEWVRERTANGTEPTDLYQQLLDTIEPALLDEVLRQLDGNRLAAARWLGLARATVRKMLRKYHPTVDEPDGDE